MSPSKLDRLVINESDWTFAVFRRVEDRWAEKSRGVLRPQVGCYHVTPYIADGGAYFAAWRMPLNYDPGQNTPLAIYFGNGTHYRTLGLFDLFDENFLAGDIERAQRIT